MNNERKKLLVEFPGRNYSCDKPLLYYGGIVFEDRGYDVIRLGFNYRLKGDKNDITGLVKEACGYAVEELKKVDFSQYDDIVFLSKSMGTAVAGYIEKYFNIDVRQIFLTPVPDTLEYMHNGNCIVVAGKEDQFLDARRLKIFCVENEIAIKQFEEVGHSLEFRGDLNKTFAILMVIIRMYREF